ncbi:MAG: butyrate kinase [Synergistaceae bacterium]|jgi:butyrate kinase|nr:butyrate kinase [Synergistaceae bacterium]
MAFRVLAVYPRDVTTRIGLFEDGSDVMRREIRHDEKELAKFHNAANQWSHRLRAIEELLSEWNPLGGAPPIDAVISLVWLPRDFPDGVYLVDCGLFESLDRLPPGENLSYLSLGALLAEALSRPRGGAAYAVSAFSSVEMDQIARLSGLPELSFGRTFQSIAVKDAMIRASAEIGMEFENISAIAAHLGKNFTICAYSGGRVRDLSVSNERGPFSTARPGALPAAEIIRMAYSGSWSRDELLESIMVSGGMASYTGITDLAEVSRSASRGDAFAGFVTRSMAYQVAQEISAQATMLCGKVDAIVLTGGCANDEALTDVIKEGVSWITDKIIVYPGTDRLMIMANCAFRVLCGKERALSLGDIVTAYGRDSSR